MVNKILRIESLVVFFISIYLYYLSDASWWFFFLLILVPDLFMLGYLRSKFIGAIFYNIGHSYVAPFFLFAIAFWLDQDLLMSIGLIFISHISIDRFLGYGLKYVSSFKDTHIQRV